MTEPSMAFDKRAPLFALDIAIEVTISA